MSTAGQREREDSDTDTLNQRSHNRSARDTHLSSGSDDVPPPTAAGKLLLFASVGDAPI